MKLFGPIAFLAVGVFLLLAGQNLSDSEEGIATSVGNLLSSTWFAIALIIAGGLWLYSSTGHFRRVTA